MNLNFWQQVSSTTQFLYHHYFCHQSLICHNGVYCVMVKLAVKHKISEKMHHWDQLRPEWQTLLFKILTMEIIFYQWILLFVDCIYTTQDAETNKEHEMEETHAELLVSHWVPPQEADRGTLARYGGYRGNKILGADQNQYRCLAADRGISKG